MRLRHLIFLLVAVSVACGGGSMALAQGGEMPRTLPLPGLTPGSPFYFLDQWIEGLQRFFTFGKDAKARLEMRFAAERVAEIELLRDAKGIDDPAVRAAEQLLLRHVRTAKTFLAEEKAEDNDVADLEDDLSAELRFQSEEIKRIFQK